MIHFCSFSDQNYDNHGYWCCWSWHPIYFWWTWWEASKSFSIRLSLSTSRSQKVSFIFYEMIYPIKRIIGGLHFRMPLLFFFHAWNANWIWRRASMFFFKCCFILSKLALAMTVNGHGCGHLNYIKLWHFENLEKKIN